MRNSTSFYYLIHFIGGRKVLLVLVEAIIFPIFFLFLFYSLLCDYDVEFVEVLAMILCVVLKYDSAWLMTMMMVYTYHVKM